MNVNLHGVNLTHPDKVLYPEQGITKLGLAEYYEAVADWILPHIRLRPISLVRCPMGRARNCFFQRHAGSGVPPQIREIEISGFEESGAYLYLTGTSGLIALVQMGVLEIHPWGCRTDRPERPDRITFDLDPGEGLSFRDIVHAAKDVRQFLDVYRIEKFHKNHRRQRTACAVTDCAALHLAGSKIIRQTGCGTHDASRAQPLSHPHLES